MSFPYFKGMWGCSHASYEPTLTANTTARHVGSREQTSQRVEPSNPTFVCLCRPVCTHTSQLQSNVGSTRVSTGLEFFSQRTRGVVARNLCQGDPKHSTFYQDWSNTIGAIYTVTTTRRGQLLQDFLKRFVKFHWSY